MGGAKEICTPQINHIIHRIQELTLFVTQMEEIPHTGKRETDLNER